MAGFLGIRISAALAGVGLAALAAGCATQTSSPAYRSSAYYTGADRLYRDNFVRNTRPHSVDRTAPQFASAPPTQPRSLAAFDGIAGARLAHEILTEVEAEQVDGACETRVKLLAGETLYDIEKFCDVPVSMLLAYNPQLRSARHVPRGAEIEIPQLANPERAALVAAGAAGGIDGLLAAVAYVVQPGDSLNTIAGKHLVSTAQVLNANPTLDWVSLPVGTTVWIPAAQSPLAPQVATPSAAVAPGATTGSLPYQFKHSGGAGSSSDISSVMPYVMTPAQEAVQNSAPRNLLTIDRRTVEPGGKVTVSSGEKQLPANATVSLYSGANGSQLRFVKTVRTDASGKFTESLSVDSSGGVGGVIFEAIVEDDGTRLQSPRVGVAR